MANPYENYYAAYSSYGYGQPTTSATQTARPYGQTNQQFQQYYATTPTTPAPTTPSPQNNPSVITPANVNALWVGDIEQWMDEGYLYSLFAHTGHVTHVKIIRDKATNLPSGYGFVYFSSPDMAQRVLETYNGQPIPGTKKTYRYYFSFH